MWNPKFWIKKTQPACQQFYQVLKLYAISFMTKRAWTKKSEKEQKEQKVKTKALIPER